MLVIALSILVCLLTSIVIAALYEYSLSRLLDRIRDQDEERKERYRKLSDHEERTIVSAKVLRGLALTSGTVALSLLYTEPLPHLIEIGLLGFFGLFLGACMLPELIAQHFAESIVLHGRRGIELLDGCMSIPTKIIVGLGEVGRRVLGASEVSEEQEVEDEILDGLTTGERAHLVDAQQTEMIRSIFELDDTDVMDVMTPRTDVVMIHVETPLMEAVEQAIGGGHSRIPVFGENRDEIVGVLYVKDLLRTWVSGEADDKSLRDHLRKAFFVPQTRKIISLLAEMRRLRIHLAVILDEYGGCAGICTIEDIVEEIVGEIRDEHDVEEQLDPLIQLEEGKVECEGLTHIDELQDAIGLSLEVENGDLDTVAGYVFASLGKIPDTGSQHVIGRLRFTVLEGDERRIKRLRAEVLPESSDG